MTIFVIVKIKDRAIKFLHLLRKEEYAIKNRKQ